jgi:uroporphyrinogen III methyltransferase/synthase
VNKITVPQADTLVYYMAADTLAEVARKIIAGGWDPGTPAAGITKATCPGQRVAFFTLADLAEKGHKSVRLESPLLLIVGKAVKNGRTKNWFSIRKKILFTGTRPEHFQDHGEIVHQPLIAIEPLPEYREADEVLRRLQHFDWVVFTSQHTVRFFFDRLASLGWDSRALHGLRIASVGAETTRALAQKGLSPDLQPRVESAQGLIKVFSEFLTRPAAMLLPHSDLAPRRLEQGLTRLGHRPVPVVLYRTIPATPVTWDWDGIDQIYFTSPSGVKNFKHLHRKIPGNVHCAAIGPETERALRYAKIQKI